MKIFLKTRTFSQISFSFSSVIYLKEMILSWKKLQSSWYRVRATTCRLDKKKQRGIAIERKK